MYSFIEDIINFVYLLVYIFNVFISFFFCLFIYVSIYPPIHTQDTIQLYFGNIKQAYIALNTSATLTIETVD